MADVATIVQELVDDLVAADPVLATGVGLTNGMDRLPTYTPAAVAALLATSRERLAELEPFALGDDVPVAVDAFAGMQIARRLIRDFELIQTHRRHPSLYLAATNGLLSIMLRELAPTEDRIKALEARLRALPALLDEARQNLDAQLPRATVESAIDYADGVRELVGVTVRDFAAEAGREGALDDAAQLAEAAVAAFAGRLREVYLPVATEDCAVGRAVLEDILRYEHVLSLTPEEIAATGRLVMQETLTAMLALASEMGFDDVEAAISALQAEHPGQDDLVAVYARAVAEARQFVVDHDLVSIAADERIVVETTPSALRTILPFAAYDPPGPFADDQVGFYWVTPPPDGLSAAELEETLRNHPSVSLPTVGVHEAYPGHHLQFTRANRAATLARRVAWLPAGANLIIEGWAFYCEEMMERAGFLAAPGVRLMRLNDQVWRACRVVIDVELHLGLMSFDEAVAFLEKTAHMNQREAKLECQRYVEEPGQPMSYLMGKLEVMKLATAYTQQRGGSLKQFHDELLAWGALPPSVIGWGMGLAARPF